MNDVTKLTKAVKKLFDKIANLVTKEELQNYGKKLIFRIQIIL